MKHICRKVRDYFSQKEDCGKYMDEYCAIASYKLFEELKRANYSPELVVGEFPEFGHCWIELDGKVIDITATQFLNSFPEILVEDVNKYLHVMNKSIYEFNNGRITKFKNKHSFKKFLKNQGWPKHQLPS
jgi:hypothetical protein